MGARADVLARLPVPTITVRNVTPKVVQSLKALARRHNRSMEQEVRELLEGLGRRAWGGARPIDGVVVPAGASPDDDRSRRMARNRAAVTAVVDTNVVAYVLLGTESVVDEAREALAGVIDPARAGPLGSRTGQRPLDGRPDGAAAHRGRAGPPRPGAAAGHRVGADGDAVYRAPFCGRSRRASPSTTRCSWRLAVRARCRLLTFDKALLRAFPDVATRPRDL